MKALSCNVKVCSKVCNGLTLGVSLVFRLGVSLGETEKKGTHGQDYPLERQLAAVD